jgi:hypothetical protein
MCRHYKKEITPSDRIHDVKQSQGLDYTMHPLFRGKQNNLLFSWDKFSMFVNLNYSVVTLFFAKHINVVCIKNQS